MPAPGAIQIRPATADDVELIHSFIVELAVYEGAPEQVAGTPELLADALFGTRPSAEAVIAELDSEAAGLAVFHGTFSTWEGRPGIWLEDLFVPDRYRRAGVGGALLAHLSRLTLERGATRLEWNALDWNSPALDFYSKLGAQRLSSWELHRLDGEELGRVAAASGASGA
jgi:GNAT superfamily N-acetyltransferase